jgi:molybdopterin-containing oxidoreductase family membrane subunit
MNGTVIGQFEDLEKLLYAAQRLKERGYQSSTLSPVSLHEEIEPMMAEKKNPIKYFTFIGAFTGFFFGIILTLGSSMLYPLPRGGRPIFFIPPVVVLSYETTILFGVLGTLAGFFLFSGLPSFKKKPYLPDAMEGSFGLVVENSENNREEIHKIMEETGAEKVIWYEN